MPRLILSCFFTVMLSLFAIVCPAADTSFDYIVDTDIGGDIDDVLALLLALDSSHQPLAVTTNHIEPEDKARIAKLIMTERGFPSIPVYAGIGVKRTDSKYLFLQQNPLWPPFYGYPNPDEGEKSWHIRQAAAYRRVYGQRFNDLPVESESAPAFIVRTAKHYSPEHKLVIVALGPLHNIHAALLLDETIKDNIKLYAMGGDYPKGYNGLISPEITADVLNQIETVFISSEFIESHHFYISPEEFDNIAQHLQSHLGQAVLEDWKNWHRIDANHKKNTGLADPVTLFLALHSEEINHYIPQTIAFPCLNAQGILKQEFKGLWYSMPGLDRQLIQMMETPTSPIRAVANIIDRNKIKQAIMQAILRLS
ncbi:nucleoside hydrolase [Legionella sp. MW5194]|uniref:nucleoside hydrolase n=1 Tax=Legionella sp. MW5194 TaxID=2662448 RepID=UPI00193E36EE|nr:nucleoside hydrolase [Legionella sp. MW5194]QRN02566.1 nucleoside hydrolase [Legionella sp. MW5194]